MNQGRTVFSQLISFLPDREFRRCVERYQGDLRLRGFSCWDQYLAMAFAQLTYRESLRDIEACLGSLQGKLVALYFNVFVAIVQGFLKIPALKAIAPTQKEAPFIIAQVLAMGIFVVLTILATKRFHVEQPRTA